MSPYFYKIMMTPNHGHTWINLFASGGKRRKQFVALAIYPQLQLMEDVACSVDKTQQINGFKRPVLKVNHKLRLKQMVQDLLSNRLKNQQQLDPHLNLKTMMIQFRNQPQNKVFPLIGQ